MLTQAQTEALQMYLETHIGSLEALVIDLAWEGCLTRAEILSLYSGQMGEDHVLYLPDRVVPVPQRLYRLWQSVVGNKGQACALDNKNWRVCLSARGEVLSPAGLSARVRTALRAAGLSGVGLQELRRDGIERLLDSRSREETVRITGLSLRGYEQLRTQRRDMPYTQLYTQEKPPPIPQDDRGEDYRLWWLQQHPEGVPGLALSLALALGLCPGELVALRWGDLDDACQTLRTARELYTLPESLSEALRARRQALAPAPTAPVLTTPQSGAPLTTQRLGRMVNTVLIRQGLYPHTLSSLGRQRRYIRSAQRVLDFVRAHGKISRREVCAQLPLSSQAASSLLARMVQEKSLYRVATRYYLAPAGNPQETIRACLLEGPAYLQDLSRQVGLPARPTATILRRMIQSGQVYVLPSRQYALCEFRET